MTDFDEILQKYSKQAGRRLVRSLVTICDILVSMFIWPLGLLIHLHLGLMITIQTEFHHTLYAAN